MSLVELEPLGRAHAAALWSAIESSRPQLRRRLRWVDAVRGAGDCEAFLRQGRDALGVFESETGALVGVAELQAEGEIAVWIAADRWRRGYGGQAARLLVARGLKARHRVYARIEPSNRAARKVLRALGFQYEGRLRRHKKLNGRWIDQELWGLLKEEWKP